LSETAEVPKGRRSRKLLIIVSVVAAAALITVVSILTGGQQTNSSVNRLVGKHVKSFTLAGLNGGKVSAPWVTGHPTVLVFFASYCGPCKTEMPEIAKYIRTTNLTPVDVVAVDVTDVRSAAQVMVKKDGVTFPVAFDPNRGRDVRHLRLRLRSRKRVRERERDRHRRVLWRDSEEATR